jgi:Trypsin-co-occurring domain 2
MIELAEVIRQLRGELERARVDAGEEELRFELGPIELEVTVGLEKDGGAGAKVRFCVVELSGDARAAATNTQRIKLTLQPTLPATAALAVEAQRTSVYVSGDEEVGER